MGSNCTWNAGIVGNYPPDRIMKADSTGIELTGSVLYEVAGNIGIGVAPTGSKLEVNGTFRLGTNGTPLNSIIKAGPTVDIASIAAGICTAQIFTVTNAIV